MSAIAPPITSIELDRWRTVVDSGARLDRDAETRLRSEAQRLAEVIEEFDEPVRAAVAEERDRLGRDFTADEVETLRLTKPELAPLLDPVGRWLRVVSILDAQTVRVEPMAPDELTRLESKVQHVHGLIGLSAAEKTALGQEKVRLADEHVRQQELLREAERDEKTRLGPELTRDELYEASPELRDLKAQSDTTLAQWTRAKAITDTLTARPSAGRAIGDPRAPTGSMGTNTASGTNSARGAFNGVMLVIIIVGVIAVLTSGGKSQPQPGDPNGADVSIKSCDISANPDGSVHAQATVDNVGTRNEQANVLITIHWLGGATDDDGSLLGNGYSVPPGTQQVAHDFNVSGGQPPISCNATLQ